MNDCDVDVSCSSTEQASWAEVPKLLSILRFDKGPGGRFFLLNLNLLNQNQFFKRKTTRKWNYAETYHLAEWLRNYR